MRLEIFSTLPPGHSFINSLGGRWQIRVYVSKPGIFSGLAPYAVEQLKLAQVERKRVYYTLAA